MSIAQTSSSAHGISLHPRSKIFSGQGIFLNAETLLSALLMHMKLDLSDLIDLQSFWSEGELNLNSRGERLVQYSSSLSCLFSHHSKTERRFLNSFTVQHFTTPSKSILVSFHCICVSVFVSELMHLPRQYGIANPYIMSQNQEWTGSSWKWLLKRPPLTITYVLPKDTFGLISMFSCPNFCSG